MRSHTLDLALKSDAVAAIDNTLQVDLSTSSIRPGKPASWHADLQETLQTAVAQSTARIAVYTGTWQHDVDQAHLLEHHPQVQLKVSAAPELDTCPAWHALACGRQPGCKEWHDTGGCSSSACMRVATCNMQGQMRLHLTSRHKGCAQKALFFSPSQAW